MSKLKNLLLYLLCFSIILSFTACTSISFKEPSAYKDLLSAYNKGTDCSMNFWTTMSSAITPDEDGYYVAFGNFLLFFDKESSVTTPVCNRPDCSHRDDQCSAYFIRTSGGFLQSYEGRLYLETIETDVNGYTSYWLYCVNPQDCTRSKVCQLPYGGISAYNYWMHRGYLYMSRLDIETRQFILERVALNELPEKSLTPERIFETATTGYSIPYVLGNTVYIMCNLPNNEGRYLMHTTAINVQTLEATKLEMPDMQEEAYMLFQNAYDDKIVATYVDTQAHIRGDRTMIYYLYDPDTDSYEPFTTLQDRGEGYYEYYSFDGENHQAFYYGYNPSDRPEMQEFRILDGNFETEKRIETDYNIVTFMAGDSDFMFFEADSEDGTHTILYAIDKRGEELKIVKVFE